MFSIDPTSATPPFEQLRDQLIARIESGELAPGDKLPAVRRLAEELGLAPNTVARTYRELEAMGRVHTRGRNGTVVAAPEIAGDVHERAVALTRNHVAQMTALGLSREAIGQYLQRGLTDH